MFGKIINTHLNTMISIFVKFTSELLVANFYEVLQFCKLHEVIFLLSTM